MWVSNVGWAKLGNTTTDLGQTLLNSGVLTYASIVSLGLTGAVILLHIASHPPAGEPGPFYMMTEFSKEQALKLKCFFSSKVQNLPKSLPHCIRWSNQVHKTGQDPKDGDTGSTSCTWHSWVAKYGGSLQIYHTCFKNSTMGKLSQ